MSESMMQMRASSRRLAKKRRLFVKDTWAVLVMISAVAFAAAGLVAYTGWLSPSHALIVWGAFEVTMIGGWVWEYANQ